MTEKLRVADPQEESERVIVAAIEKHARGDVAALARRIIEELRAAGLEIRRTDAIPIRNPGCRKRGTRWLRGAATSAAFSLCIDALPSKLLTQPNQSASSPGVHRRLFGYPRPGANRSCERQQGNAAAGIGIRRSPE